MEHVEKTADGKWMCNICERKMRTRAYVKEHVETHIVGLSFPCQNAVLLPGLDILSEIIFVVFCKQRQS